MTFDKLVGLVRDFLAALGLVAFFVLIGLYQSGFFAWAAIAMPRLFGWLA